MTGAVRAHPAHLRAILTVPLRPGTDARDPALWARTLPTWTFTDVRGPDGRLVPEAEAIVRLVSPADQGQVRAGAVLLAHALQSSDPPPLLAHLTPDGRAVTLRVFARYLTELQALAERVTEALSREPAFLVTPDLRVIVAIVVDGVRHDLTGGRVQPGRGGAWRSFYHGNKYAVNVTLGVLLVTLAVVLVFTPSAPYTPLGKVYGLNERVLSAVLLNALLLGSQFMSFVRHRALIVWERP
ncbi:hypothetical protein [Deinococcus aquiradiocola]|uniref:Uncharacterized protein n=1 Tax=Deinococcus aquiradiocola TaxID=393059 RepID=A0A917UPV0_9DEIO|nr:hypothetical protein [Deinococcus aquiradiocola]GGJ74220.1 hypothetical protein GCM10008939_18140 [Deinococcus aquiradiocola]